MDLSTRSSLSPINITELLNNEDIVQLHIAAAEYSCNASHINPSFEGCPRVFDGWSCWNETLPGQTAYAPCPWFISGFDPELKAHKLCLEDSSWFLHPESNSIWSNYTSCINLDALTNYKLVVSIYEIGYLISLCALILSLIIFCSFRSLQCTRVQIHKQLFISFIVNNTLWLIWYRFVMSEHFSELNPIGCALLHLLVQYFLVANYFWMFCEGLYLHTLLVYSFTPESTLLKAFYFFGWAGPSIPLSLYGAFRASDGDANEQEHCWINESKWSLCLSVPVCICLVLSLAFLINILRVLLTKLNANRRSLCNNRRESMADNTASLRKAARACLILIPLLGLHYLMTPFRPPPASNLFLYYEYMTAISASLQGLSVSLLFCFCNGEVIAAMRRKFTTVKATTTSSTVFIVFCFCF